MFKNRIAGIETLTLADYPGKVAAILFYTGCNIRCGYCYNALVVKNQLNLLDSDYIIDFLQRRQGKLDAIVFSGGECTIHGDKLIEDIEYVKSLGYAVKVDTNGTNPKLIEKLIEKNLVDYIALDYKCPEEKYSSFGFTEVSYKNFTNTLGQLIRISFPFEVRTTIHPELISEENINNMQKVLSEYGYCGNYYLQFFFRQSVEILDKSLSMNPRYFDIDKIEKIENIMVQYRNSEDNI